LAEVAREDGGHELALAEDPHVPLAAVDHRSRIKVAVEQSRRAPGGSECADTSRKPLYPKAPSKRPFVRGSCFIAGVGFKQTSATVYRLEATVDLS